MGSASVEREDARDLGEFVRSGSATAFERLARRYAGLVYSACLRRLGSPEDAEDASQVVFLVLASRAGSVRAERLATWLHGTCLRASNITARARGRRARHEKEAAAMYRPSAEVPDPAQAEARRHLDAEVAELPGKLREAVSRHYLAGQSHAELSRALGVPEGTVASRVAAGLERLRRRLSRRGVELSAAGLGALLAAEASAAVPPSLLASLPHLASGVAAASAAAGAGGTVSAAAKGVLKLLFWEKVKVAAAVLAVGLLPAAAIPVVAGWAAGGDKPRANAPAEEPAAERPAAESPAAPAAGPEQVAGGLQLSLVLKDRAFRSGDGKAAERKRKVPILHFKNVGEEPLVLSFPSSAGGVGRRGAGNLGPIKVFAKGADGKEVPRLEAGRAGRAEEPRPEDRPALLTVLKPGQVLEGAVFEGLRFPADGQYTLWAVVEVEAAEELLPGLRPWSGKLESNKLEYDYRGFARGGRGDQAGGAGQAPTPVPADPESF